MIMCGLVYRTPFPVQPMKAIGAIATTQAAQTLTVTAGAVYAAGLASGIIWLLLGLTGTAQKVAKLISRPVVVGIILGLGFGFMLNGVKMMADSWWIGGFALAGTLLLLGNRRVPAMFLLLIFGAVCGIIVDPTLTGQLAGIAIEPRLPTVRLGRHWLERRVDRHCVPGSAAGAADPRQRHHRDHRREQSTVPRPPGHRTAGSGLDRPDESRQRGAGRNTDVSRRRRDGRTRSLRRADRWRADHPGRHSHASGTLLQQLRSERFCASSRLRFSASSCFSPVRSWRLAPATSARTRGSASRQS